MSEQQKSSAHDRHFIEQQLSLCGRQRSSAIRLHLYSGRVRFADPSERRAHAVETTTRRLRLACAGASKYQRKDADDDEQANQGKDADSAGEKFEHDAWLHARDTCMTIGGATMFQRYALSAACWRRTANSCSSAPILL
ncbi:hypothetical protein JM946_14415 [Steroidobacter sp. S1-65]|uniref:Uncharacterized protein n=2 Tax=Steroidobacter gossypii TaxID=2805490 RepID=A0ABS1WY59_9GAMM|nr:hypothetical protein [Steroidobacter gossypii]